MQGGAQLLSDTMAPVSFTTMGGGGGTAVVPSWV